MERCLRALNVPPLDGRRPVPCEVEHAQHRLRTVAASQRPLPGDVVVTVHRGNDDALLISSNEFGVHHHARHASVAVGERVYFGNQEMDERGAVEWRIECPVHLEAPLEGADDRVRTYEFDSAHAIRCGLEPAWHHIPASLEHARMTFAQQLQKLRCGFRDATHLGGVRHDAPNANHVVCVGWTLLGDTPAENDRFRLLWGELRSLDVVREIGIEERLGRGTDTVAPPRSPRWARCAQQLGMQITEQRQPCRVVGVSGRSCACRGGREPGLASTGERSDDSVEFRELGDAVDVGGDAAGIVAQTIAGILAGGREHALQVRLDVQSMQSPGQPPAPRP